MAGPEFAYFYLGCGLVVIWLFGLSYFHRSLTKAKSEHQWLAYFLLWPVLLRNRKGQNFTWRELAMIALLISVVVGAIIVDQFFPVSSREISP